MERLFKKPEIVQCGTGQKHAFREFVFAQSAFIFDDPVSFYTADGVFNAYTDGGNQPILLFLFPTQLPCSGLFLRLLEGYAFRAVALITQVLPKGKSLRNAVVVVGHLFIMDAARNRGTDKQNQAKHRGHYRIFKGVLFLFAAVMVLLPLLIAGTGDFPFSAIPPFSLENKFFG